MGYIQREATSSTTSIGATPAHKMNAAVLKRDSTATTTPPTEALSEQTSSKGAVDRLTSFFLSRFQEAKKDGDLAELQCTTRVKIETVERALGEHASAIGLMREEMRTFWDKAPSFFLHKFSGQLDALGVGRSEKNEQALARFEQRMDDEIKNINEQLSALSTKLAVGTASLNATVDQIGYKIRAADDTSAEALRRCENELRSKVARLDSLVSSTKTETDIERDKLNRSLQETNKKLHEKMDSLELAVAMTRQPEDERVLQVQAIDRLERDVQKLTQMVLSQNKVNSTLTQMVTAQGQELAKLEMLRTQQQELQRVSSSQYPIMPTACYPSSQEYKPAIALAPNIGRTPLYAQNAFDKQQGLGYTMDASSVTQRIPPSSSPTQQSKRRRESPERRPLVEVNRTSNCQAGPNSKRQRTVEGKENGGLSQHRESPKDTTEVKANYGTPYAALGEQKIAHSKRKKQQSKLAPSKAAPKPGAITRYPQSTPKSTKQEALSSEQGSGRTEVTQDAPQASTVQHAQRRSPRRKQQAVEVLPRQPEKDAEKPEKQRKQPQSTKDILGEGDETGAGIEEAPKGVDNKESKKRKGSESRELENQEAQQASTNRREAMQSFIMYVKTYAHEYNANPPRSERQFIWSFLEDIPDPRFSVYIQMKLLEMYPDVVKKSLGTRPKHAINFDVGLTWRHVVALIRNLQKAAS